MDAAGPRRCRWRRRNARPHAHAANAIALALATRAHAAARAHAAPVAAAAAWRRLPAAGSERGHSGRRPVCAAARRCGHGECNGAAGPDAA